MGTLSESPWNYYVLLITSGTVTPIGSHVGAYTVHTKSCLITRYSGVLTVGLFAEVVIIVLGLIVRPVRLQWVRIMWITFRTFDVTKAVGEATFHVMTCNCVDIQSGYTHVSSPIRMGVGTCNHTVYGQLTCLHLFRLKCQVPARGGRVLS